MESICAIETERGKTRFGSPSFLTSALFLKILRGHMRSVLFVQFIPSRGQLLSFSKDKILRIWDVQLQICLQRLSNIFPRGPEGKSDVFIREKQRSV
jgi:WD40 repeat protein